MLKTLIKVDIMHLKCILIQQDYLMEFIEENKKNG